MSAAASRYLAVNTASLPSSPVCFVKPNVGPSLEAQARAQRAERVCTDAARGQGIVIVPYDSPACAAAATLVWSSSRTGAFVADCNAYTGECVGGDLHGKSLRLLVNQRSTGTQLSETHAVFNSEFGQLNDRSIFALCSTVFHRYPEAFENEQVEAPTE